MAFTKITITGQYLQPNSASTPAVGTISFALTGVMQDATDKQIVVPEPVTVTLNGTGSIPAGTQLDATDDATTQPTGLLYLVTETITGAPTRSYYIAVPHAGGTIDLSAVAPTTPGAVVYTTGVTAGAGISVTGLGTITDLLASVYFR